MLFGRKAAAPTTGCKGLNPVGFEKVFSALFNFNVRIYGVPDR